MIKKSDLLAQLNDLPEHIPATELEALIGRLVLEEKIQESKAAIQRGETLTQAEVEKRFEEKWSR